MKFVIVKNLKNMNIEDVISAKSLLQGGLKTPEIPTCA